MILIVKVQHCFKLLPIAVSPSEKGLLNRISFLLFLAVRWVHIILKVDTLLIDIVHHAFHSLIYCVECGCGVCRIPLLEEMSTSRSWMLLMVLPPVKVLHIFLMCSM